MNNHHVRNKHLVGILLLSAVLLSSCSTLLPTVEPTPDPLLSTTNVAQTVVAELTRIADQNTPTTEPTVIPPTTTPTDTPAIPTPSPTNTPTPLPTTPPLPCDWAKFVKDVSVEDSAQLNPSERFRKIWRLKNIGSCTWTPEYDLVFTGGDRLGAKATIPLTGYVLPGGTADINVDLTAPEKAGSYRGFWQLRNAGGLLFGLGDRTDAPFWVDIEVNEPQRKLFYDFARNYCDADWKTGAGIAGCFVKMDDKRGFIYYLENPRLENRHEDEPTLWVHPNHDSSGWISGTYPAVRIEDGDRFRAWVGCMDDNEGCRVDFHLDYQFAIGGPIKNLAAWQETFEGKVTVIDLDLSDLSGKKVHFILSATVENGAPEKANAFWFVPRIDRVAK